MKAQLATLAASLADALEFDWQVHARPEQLPPEGDWFTWLILAGRGAGKTRTGAEWIRAQMCGPTPLARGRYRHIALIGETAADVRDVMVGEGKGPGEGSGILQVHPKDFRPLYEPSKRRLTWPNGAQATLYNATEPDQLRGPEHEAAWCDELAKWPLAEQTWDMLQFGLRRGDSPRVVITTTPRPIKLLKRIMAEPGTVVTRGRTVDNAANLAPKFLTKIMAQYAGTRLGRQELEAELLEDVAGALWRREDIDRSRIKPEDMPQLVRVVVAIDPSVSSRESSDQTGIVVAGLGADGHGYVLEDASAVMSPDAWAQTAIKAYWRHKADRVIGEVNNGGDLVESVLRTVDPNVSYKAVHASRGKVARAEPVAALYEQGRVHHVGAFPELEDEMIAFTSDFDRRAAGYSPDRLDALVWALTELIVGANGTGILDFYRREVELMQRAQSAETSVRLRAPAGISNAIGLSGRGYAVDGEGTVVVDAADVPPLLVAGWERIEESGEPGTASAA